MFRLAKLKWLQGMETGPINNKAKIVIGPQTLTVLKTGI